VAVSKTDENDYTTFFVTKIGLGAWVAANARLDPKVVIGRNCSVGGRVVVKEGTNPVFHIRCTLALTLTGLGG